MTNSPQLAPNPYKRQPIKKREELAARLKEQEKIKYYLDLTASGQSPHLALIGQRGVGKTSLLNAADTIAREKLLLAVRLDMNENKADSPGRFWHDLYSAMCLHAADVGCWGGLQSQLYEALFTMLHARKAVSADRAILQFPFALASDSSGLDSLSCSDALIIFDLQNVLKELKRHGQMGIAFLVDEADCLGKNRALLQMLRNIFQRVDGCSLILAGTEAVFPVLSDVFSPIPRQFHRIDVMPFHKIADTFELIRKPLAEDRLGIGPTDEGIVELHHLCGGDPSELQLYSHHMYRKVEDGTIKKMTLHPAVFREVLLEYRASTPANLEAVVNAISKLPDRLLFRSKWLRRKRLNLQENVSLEIFREELASQVRVSEERRAEVLDKIRTSYAELYDLGITQSDARLEIVGDPLSSGFWKSLVEVEKRERWSWNELPFEKAVPRSVISRMMKDSRFRAFSAIEVQDDDTEANTEEQLRQFRSGSDPTKISVGVVIDLMVRALMGRKLNKSFAVDLYLSIVQTGSSSTHRIGYLGDTDGTQEISGEAEEWITRRLELLQLHDVSIKIQRAIAWQLPTNDELHRLALRANFTLPELDFGPDPHTIAIDLFNAGKIEEAAETFRNLVAESGKPNLRNNLAYCWLLLGRDGEALEQLEIAIAQEYSPLIAHNLAIANFVLGNSDKAISIFRKALEQAKDLEDIDKPFCMLILTHEGSLSSQYDVPIEVALLINLAMIGAFTVDEAETRIRGRYAKPDPKWFELLKRPPDKGAQPSA